MRKKYLSQRTQPARAPAREPAERGESRVDVARNFDAAQKYSGHILSVNSSESDERVRAI